MWQSVCLWQHLSFESFLFFTKNLRRIVEEWTHTFSPWKEEMTSTHSSAFSWEKERAAQETSQRKCHWRKSLIWLTHRCVMSDLREKSKLQVDGMRTLVYEFHDIFSFLSPKWIPLKNSKHSSLRFRFLKKTSRTEVCEKFFIGDFFLP